MGGRNRVGADACGSIGDAELIDKEASAKKERLAGAHRAFGVLPRKAVGVGMLVVVAGFFVWLWPSIDLYVFSYLKTLGMGPRIVGWGIVIIASTVVVKLLVLPILDIILR